MEFVAWIMVTFLFKEGGRSNDNIECGVIQPEAFGAVQGRAALPPGLPPGISGQKPPKQSRGNISLNHPGSYYSAAIQGSRKSSIR